MKAQLVVVQGKPEGKVIPLAGPNFKIGRGESCHLRPNSERVSREHAEFMLSSSDLSVRDLGSRNGTLVNGKAVPLGTVCKLKDRDLVQVGPLTFAVAILSEATVATTNGIAAPAAPVTKPRISPDDVSTDDIDSWLVGAGGGSTADLPTTVYKGETQTITAFQGKTKPAPPMPPVPAPVPVQPSIIKPEAHEEQEYEELEQEHEAELNAETEVAETEVYDRFDSENEEEESEDNETSEETPDDFVDESNPFHAAKKAAQVVTPVKAALQDTSDVAHDILRKLMQQRKASKS